MMCSTIDYVQPCVCHLPEYSIGNLFFRKYHQTDNKQTYSHAIKLPEGRSGEIRFLRYKAVSGSVTRTRNNHTALLWR